MSVPKNKTDQVPEGQSPLLTPKSLDKSAWHEDMDAVACTQLLKGQGEHKSR